jgi:hypothetical protein
MIVISFEFLNLKFGTKKEQKRDKKLFKNLIFKYKSNNSVENFYYHLIKLLLLMKKIEIKPNYKYILLIIL